MKNLELSSIVFLIGLTVFVGCGSNSEGGPGNPTMPQSNRLNGAEYVKLVPGTLSASDNAVEGTGTIAFVEPRPKEDSNYQLSFSLEDRGSLKLIANAQAKLAKGVEILLSREGSLLRVVLDGADLSEGFSEVDATKPLSMKIDVHAHGHAIFWVNDGAELEEPFRARPTGRLWGLELNSARVTKVVAAAAIHEH